MQLPFMILEHDTILVIRHSFLALVYLKRNPIITPTPEIDYKLQTFGSLKRATNSLVSD